MHDAIGQDHHDKALPINEIPRINIDLSITESAHQIQCKHSDSLIECLEIQNESVVERSEPPHVDKQELRQKHHAGDLPPQEIHKEAQDQGKAHPAEEKDRWHNDQRPDSL